MLCSKMQLYWWKSHFKLNLCLLNDKLDTNLMHIKVWKSHLYLDRTTQLVQGWTWVDLPESSIISHFVFANFRKNAKYQKSQIFTCFANCSSGSVTESARYSTFFVQNKSFQLFMVIFVEENPSHLKVQTKMRNFPFLSREGMERWRRHEYKVSIFINSSLQRIQIRSKTISSLSYCH